jgi:N-acetylglucosamine-6-sulfatase
MVKKIHLLVLMSLFTVNCSAEPQLPSASSQETVNPTDADRPNIIVFMTDDQTLEQMRFLPNVEKLIGSEGTSFINMSVNDSDCCPSRATFLTGQQSRHHGVLWNTPPTGGFSSFKNQDTTLPVALEASGYQTLFVGKYLNRYGENIPTDRYVPPGWTDFHGLIWPAESAYYGSAFFDNGVVTENSVDTYYSGEITKRVLSGLGAAKDANKPFFTLIGYVAPHAQAGVSLEKYRTSPRSVGQQSKLDLLPIPESQYLGSYANLELPIVPSFNEALIVDKAEVNRRRLLNSEELELVTKFYRAAAESLKSVDDSVDEIIDYLTANSMLKNTYLIFTSDNGLFYGEHRFLTGKYLPLRPSRSVPLLISGPGITKGRVSNSMVSNVDLAPTIAEIATVELLRKPDGVSLLTELTSGRSLFVDRAIYVEGHAPEGRRILPFEGVVTKDYLYYVFSNGEAELYDLQSDFYELDNLILSDPSNPLITDAKRTLSPFQEVNQVSN